MEQTNKIEVYIDEESKQEYLKIPMLGTRRFSNWNKIF